MSLSTLTIIAPIFDYKANKIVIFNGDNFIDQERTYKVALIIAEGQDFITSIEDLN